MSLKEKLFGHWDKLPSTPINFNGVWRNELNSQMTISVDKNGLITGTYQPGIADGIADNTHPLVGFANNDLISFSVDFEYQHMICGWTGHFVQEQNTQYIKTQWNLVKNHERQEFSMEEWGSTHCGSNTFKRVG